MAGHSVVGINHRGILGGYVHYCSCGDSIIEPEGDKARVEAHLAGPPSEKRPGIRERMTALVLRAQNAESERDAALAAINRVQELLDGLGPCDRSSIRHALRGE